LEAAAYGVVFGLTFTVGIFAFAVLNVTVGVSEIARFLPNAARGAATVITVTMNFVPATVTTAREIREAQDIRGLAYGRGLAGAVRRAGAVVTPLIIAGLERAVVTAESMESRAYGNPEARSASGGRLAWSAKDIAGIILAVLPLAVIVVASVSGALAWSPYPRLTLPDFNPVIGLALCLYAYPAIVKK